MDDNIPNARWKEVYNRVVSERQELDSEIERQRLLDELADSRTKNTQLEHALAKLAREQDRVALMERERILKRAQVAQATAALVHEANWVKQRMEAEMRVAKQRALMLDPPKSEYQQTGPSLKSVHMGGMPLTFANVPYEAEPSDRSPSDKKPGVEVSQGSADAMKIDQDEEPVLPDLASIGSALSSSYTGVMSSFFGTDPLPAFAATPAMSSVAQPSEPSQPKAVVPKKKKVTSSQQGSVTNPSVESLSMADSNLPRKRLMKAGFNAEWKNQTLQEQASEILSNSSKQRDRELQSKPVMMGQMFGLPIGKDDNIPTMQTKQEWVAMADDWLKSVSSETKPQDQALKSRVETQVPKPARPAELNQDAPSPPVSATLNKPGETRISKENSLASNPTGAPPEKTAAGAPTAPSDPKEGGKDGGKDKKCLIM